MAPTGAIVLETCIFDGAAGGGCGGGRPAPALALALVSRLPALATQDGQDEAVTACGSVRVVVLDVQEHEQRLLAEEGRAAGRGNPDEAPNGFKIAAEFSIGLQNL